MEKLAFNKVFSSGVVNQVNNSPKLKALAVALTVFAAYGMSRSGTTTKSLDGRATEPSKMGLIQRIKAIIVAFVMSLFGSSSKGGGSTPVSGQMPSSIGDGYVVVPHLTSIAADLVEELFLENSVKELVDWDLNRLVPGFDDTDEDFLAGLDSDLNEIEERQTGNLRKLFLFTHEKAQDAY